MSFNEVLFDVPGGRCASGVYGAMMADSPERPGILGGAPTGVVPERNTSAASRVAPADLPVPREDELQSRALDIIDALQVLRSGVGVFAPDLRTLAINDSLAGWFGVAGVVMSGRYLHEVLPEGDAAPEVALVRETARDGVPRACCRSEGGKAFEIRTERLNSGFVVVEAMDATAQASLERRMDHVLESITDGFCVLDARWRIAYWNAAAARMTGLRPSEVVGRGVTVAFGNMGGSELGFRFMETLRRKVPTEIRSWSYGGNEAGRAAGIYDAYIYPVEGSGAVVIFREVSERVRQEQELLERRTEAETLHRLVRAIAAVNDSSELRQTLAQTAMDSCGARGSAVIEIRGADGVVTSAAGDSLPLIGTRISLADSLTERVLAARDIVSVADYSTSFPQHQARLLGQLLGPVLATPLVAHDHPLGVLIVSRGPGAELFSARAAERLRVLADHAALALWKLRLVDDAQAANHAKSDFMTAMSHELRTPIASLAGYGEILAEQVAGPLSAEQLDLVQRMQSVTDHLAGLIDEILTYSSLDADPGDEDVKMVRVLLGDVLRESVAVVEPTALAKGIQLDCDVADDIVLRTDPVRLRQILVHLLSNAIKFTDHGHVRFREAREGSLLKLHIEDTGIGIAPEDRDRIFEPFTQLDSGLTRRHRGAGLGLFISQRLAAQIGGVVDCRSTIGKGSAFTLTLSGAI